MTVLSSKEMQLGFFPQYMLYKIILFKKKIWILGNCLILHWELNCVIKQLLVSEFWFGQKHVNKWSK